MAEFVTRKEAQRRLWTVVVCAGLSVIALAIGLINYKNISDEEKAENAGSVAKLSRSVAEAMCTNQQPGPDLRDSATSSGCGRRSSDALSRTQEAGTATGDATHGLSGINPKV